jgi:hypothetical protein
MAPPDAPIGSGTQRDPNPRTRRWFHLAEDVWRAVSFLLGSGFGQRFSAANDYHQQAGIVA